MEPHAGFVLARGPTREHCRGRRGKSDERKLRVDGGHTLSAGSGQTPAPCGLLRVGYCGRLGGYSDCGRRGEYGDCARRGERRYGLCRGSHGRLGRWRRRRAPPPQRGAWIVTITTPQTPLRMIVLTRWEEELRAIERRHPGCCFLGWTTPRTQAAVLGATGSQPPEGA